MQADPVLVVVSARPGELPRLGPGWQRFLTGDHRAGRVRLGGLVPGEVMALGRALGAGELPPRAAGRLLAETGGNPLYCRAMLEEFGAAGLDRPGEVVSVPRSLAGVILLRVGALSPAARDLVAAASVLGSPCVLAAAAALAGLADPLAALGEAVAAGILSEQQPDAAAARIGFTHLLVQRAVYEDLTPARRRELHQRAGGLVDRYRALGHRVAAAAGPDDGLAAELEAASGEAGGLGQMAQAAAWLARAAAVSSDPEEADRRLLDALEILVGCGEVAQAQTLAARAAAAGPSPRRSRLLGTLDFFAGRSETAEARLLDAWQAHDPVGDAADGAGAAWCLAALCLTSGRIREAIGWGERAAADGAPEPVRHLALGVLAIALVAAGQASDGLARLAFLPPAPAEVPRGGTDALVLRGVARVLAEEDLDGAVADLSTATARMRAGVRLRFPSLCLTYLASAESRLGFWDDAMAHAGLAASLAHGADRVWEFGLLHFVAVAVPALRGDWATATAHVQAAAEAAETSGDPLTVSMAAIAEAFLAMSQGDLERVLRAAATVRAAGRTEFLQKLAGYWWRILEIEALIGLRRLGQAETALAELDAALTPAGAPSALATAARLRGDLATATGNHDAAAAALETAWHHAKGLRIPLTVAQLEITDARRLRTAGHPQAAVTRLRSAHQRLLALGAGPYLEICDQELAAIRQAWTPASPSDPRPARHRKPGTSP